MRSIIIAATTCVAISVSAFGQYNCASSLNTPPAIYFTSGVAPGLQAWPQNYGTVTYSPYCGTHNGYYSCLTQNQSGDLSTALNNWANDSYTSKSGINGFDFSFVTPPNPIQGGPANVNFFAVQQSDLPVNAVGKEVGGEFNWGKPQTLGVASIFVLMTLANGTSNDHFLQVIFAHELGHTFGLGECPSCPWQATVMSYQPVPTSNTMGLNGPGLCDNYELSTVVY